MGSLIQFGVTNRCPWCKGTGIRKGSKAICTSCGGAGYKVPYDPCLHACGCTNQVDPTLVLICMSCYNNECESKVAIE